MRIVERAFFIFVVMLVAGCAGSSRPGRAERDQPLLPGDKPVENAVHSADLRGAMLALERVTLEQLPGDVDSAPSRESRRDEVVRLADQLARAASELPDTLDTVALPADAAPRFRELSAQLHREALALRGRAVADDLGTARDETERILATCNACHAEMRITPPARSDLVP